MITRASTTLVICSLAAGVALIGLGRPAANTTSETGVPQPVATTENSTGNLPARVTIEGFAFGGTSVAVPGQTLTIDNLDSAPHTLTARSGAFDSRTIEGGGSGTLTLPTEPGTHEFFCTIHPSMVSTITVEA